VFISFGIYFLLDYSLNARERKGEGTSQCLPCNFTYKKVLSVSNTHFGCDDDKTTARFNAAITNLRNQASIWSNSVWEYYKQDGTVGIEKGSYFICDGGYYQAADSLLPTTIISSMIPLNGFGAII
jgi:hypothetical protein